MQTALNVFLLPGTQEGIAVNIVMSFIFVKIQGTFQPYLGWEEDFLGEMAQWLILIQLQVTLLLSTEIVSPYGPIGVMFFLLSGSLFLSVVVIIGWTMRAAFVAMFKAIDKKGRTLLVFLGLRCAKVETHVTDEIVASQQGDLDDSDTTNPVGKCEAQRKDALHIRLEEETKRREEEIRCRDESRQFLLSKNLPIVKPLQSLNSQVFDIPAALPSSGPARNAPVANLTTPVAIVAPHATSMSPAAPFALSKPRGLPVSPERLQSITSSVEKLFEVSQARSAMRKRISEEILVSDDTVVESIEREIFMAAEGKKEAQDELFNEIIEATRKNTDVACGLRAGSLSAKTLLAERLAARSLQFRETMKRQLRKDELCAGCNESFVERIERELFVAADGVKEDQQRLFIELKAAVNITPLSKTHLMEGAVDVITVIKQHENRSKAFL